MKNKIEKCLTSLIEDHEKYIVKPSVLDLIHGRP
jgi:hypothetical protein